MSSHVIEVEEVHAHINGSISERTIMKLIKSKKKRDAKWSPPSQISFKHGSLRSLEEGFEMFRLIHDISDCEDAAYQITSDVIEEFSEDNVKYLELRTTPRNQPATGMTKKSYLDMVIKAIQEKRRDLEIIVRLLLSIDRRTSIEDAWDTLSLAEQYRDEYPDTVVGLDFSGDPNKGDAKVFTPVFKAAKEKGFKLALHIAEVANMNEENMVLLQLEPDRIGHGTFLHPSRGGTDDILAILDKNKTPFETCLTSNVCTQTASSYKDHHFCEWYKKDHPVIICTDDKGVFDTSLTKEYSLAAKYFDLSKTDLWNISYYAIDHIFASNEIKSQLKTEWNKIKTEIL